jgi:hypothetical protein
LCGALLHRRQRNLDVLAGYLGAFVRQDAVKD